MACLMVSKIPVIFVQKELQQTTQEPLESYPALLIIIIIIINVYSD